MSQCKFTYNSFKGFFQNSIRALKFPLLTSKIEAGLERNLIWILLLSPFLHQLNAATVIANNPRLEMDAAGNTIAVWQVFDDVTFNWKIQAAIYSTTLSGWNPTINIYNLGEQSASNPIIRINQDGNAIVAWLLADPISQKNVLQAIVYFNGSWTSVSTISDSTQESINPDFNLKINSTGAIATWSAYDNTPQSIVRSAICAVLAVNIWQSPITMSN